MEGSYGQAWKVFDLENSGLPFYMLVRDLSKEKHVMRLEAEGMGSWRKRTASLSGRRARLSGLWCHNFQFAQIRDVGVRSERAPAGFARPLRADHPEWRTWFRSGACGDDLIVGD